MESGKKDRKENERKKKQLCHNVS